MKTVLVTGSASFMGYHLSELLLAERLRVVGVDGHNDYCDPHLKAARGIAEYLKWFRNYCQA